MSQRVRAAAPRDGSDARSWDVADWGSGSVITVARTPGGLLSVDEAVALHGSGAELEKPAKVVHADLDQFRSTAIAGNDLLSSCLYTSGICANYAGPLAPVALMLVSIMLGFFRHVYAEVVTALPINGGTYNALLNTTSKRLASVAACLSLLSYVATAVVSAYSAVQYVQPIWAAVDSSFAAAAFTVAILGVFALLTLFGIGESSVVAVTMFGLHVVTLTILIVMSIVHVARHGVSTFVDNCGAGFPAAAPNTGGHWDYALFLGYASALLGITGFETAANYVEEMKDSRVYLRTVRNMWISSSLFNPLLSLCAMAVMPMSDIYANFTNLLARLAEVVGGDGLHIFVCIDGFIVLAGSVLTAYVGVVGLARRLALDRVLPDVFMRTNALRGTAHWVIIGFFALTASLYLILASGSSNGDQQMNDLSGVYALAFLSVMTAFAIACLVLKVKRPDLPRLTVTSVPSVLTALIMVLIGLAGTIIKSPAVVGIFFAYFLITLAVVMIMFERTRLLRLSLYAVQSCGARGAAAREGRLRAAHVRNEDAKLRSRHKETTVGLGVTWKPASADAASSSMVDFEVPPAGSAKGGAAPAPAAATTPLIGSSARGPAADADLATPLLLPSAGRGVAGGSAVNTCDAEYGSTEGGAAGPGGADEEDELDADDDESSLPAGSCRAALLRSIKARVRAVNAVSTVFFAKDPDLAVLNKAVLYVRDNEQSDRICVVHFVDDRAAVAVLEARIAAGDVEKLLAETGVAAAASPGLSASAVQPEVALQLLEHFLPPLPSEARLLMDNVALVDAMYPKVKIDCLVVRGTYFSPASVAWLAKHLRTLPNFCFMAMPDTRFTHQFAALGGVRLITRTGTRGERERNIRHAVDVVSRLAGDVAQRQSAPA